MMIKAKGLTSVGFKPGYHGFDDIVKDGAGNFIIVEAKGGASKLGKVVSGNQQMSQGWIQEKIKQLRNSGQRELADELDKAIVDKKLKGMVVTTKVEGPNAFVPDAVVKDWDDIGIDKWIK